MIDIITAILRYAIFAVPEVIIILVSYHYVRKARSIDGKLLLTGSFLVWLNHTFFVFFFLFYRFDNNQTDLISTLSYINRGSKMVFLTLFAIGFYMLIAKYLKKAKGRATPI